MLRKAPPGEERALRPSSHAQKPWWFLPHVPSSPLEAVCVQPLKLLAPAGPGCRYPLPDLSLYHGTDAQAANVGGSTRFAFARG